MGQALPHARGRFVVIIYALNHQIALGFSTGSLLDDDEDVLVQSGRHGQAMGPLRFPCLSDITYRDATITGWIERAIQTQKDGLEVDFVETDNLTCPDELQSIRDNDPMRAGAFKTLAPGRRRGYVLRCSDVRQSTIRIARVEKCRARIPAGTGLNDRPA